MGKPSAQRNSRKVHSGTIPAPAAAWECLDIPAQREPRLCPVPTRWHLPATEWLWHRGTAPPASISLLLGSVTSCTVRPQEQSHLIAGIGNWGCFPLHMSMCHPGVPWSHRAGCHPQLCWVSQPRMGQHKSILFCPPSLAPSGPDSTCPGYLHFQCHSHKLPTSACRWCGTGTCSTGVCLGKFQFCTYWAFCSSVCFRLACERPPLKNLHRRSLPHQLRLHGRVLLAQLHCEK